MWISLFICTCAVHRCGSDGDSKNKKVVRGYDCSRIWPYFVRKAPWCNTKTGLFEAAAPPHPPAPPPRFSPSSQEPQLHSLSYLKVSAGAQSAAFSPLGSLVARCSSVPEPVWAHHRSGPGLKDLILTSALRLANVTIYSYFVNRCAARRSA